MLAIEQQHAAHAVGAAGRGWARPAELGLEGADIVAPDGSCVAAGLTLAVRAGQVRTIPSWPRTWANFSLL